MKMLTYGVKIIGIVYSSRVTSLSETNLYTKENYFTGMSQTSIYLSCLLHFSTLSFTL
jgi:hypothetical protein